MLHFESKITEIRFLLAIGFEILHQVAVGLLFDQFAKQERAQQCGRNPILQTSKGIRMLCIHSFIVYKDQILSVRKKCTVLYKG